MSMVRCIKCGRRYATPSYRCRNCGASEFEAAPVRGEQASTQATTAVWVGVPDPPLHLVIAQLSDVAVLATATWPVRIGDSVLLDDGPDGGFVVTSAIGASDASGAPR